MDVTSVALRSQRLLKWAYGAVLVAIGLDKVSGLNLIVNWDKYVSPLAQSVLQVPPKVIVLGLGTAEIVIGVCMLVVWTRAMAYVTIAALAVIIINLLSMGYGYYDIAARDFLIALGALVLAWLTSAVGER